MKTTNAQRTAMRRLAHEGGHLTGKFYNGVARCQVPGCDFVIGVLSDGSYMATCTTGPCSGVDPTLTKKVDCARQFFTLCDMSPEAVARIEQRLGFTSVCAVDATDAEAFTLEVDPERLVLV